MGAKTPHVREFADFTLRANAGLRKPQPWIASLGPIFASSVGIRNFGDSSGGGACLRRPFSCANPILIGDKMTLDPDPSAV